MAQPQKPDADGHREIRYVYRCKANRLHGAGACAGGASITALIAEQYVVNWLFDFFSSDRLEEHYTRARRTADAHTRRVADDLALARAEQVALREHQTTRLKDPSIIAITTGLLADVEQRITMLEQEREALTCGQSEPLTHHQLVSTRPTASNSSRKMLLRQVGLLHE